VDSAASDPGSSRWMGTSGTKIQHRYCTIHGLVVVALLVRSRWEKRRRNWVDRQPWMVRERLVENQVGRGTSTCALTIVDEQPSRSIA
jgi:hypothetical protein